MKKFMCTIPLQTSKGLDKVVYSAVDNKKIQYSKAVSFPIIPVINGYVDDGETIEILVLKQIGEGTDNNYEEFRMQLRELCDNRNIRFTCRIISIVFDETAGTHLQTFVNLIENFHDSDCLYACMTFGTKPIPMIEMMALNYAYRNLRQVRIGCIVYGQKNWSIGTNVIYDITSLFSMDEIVHEISGKGMKDPLGYIKDIMNYTLE